MLIDFTLPLHDSPVSELVDLIVSAYEPGRMSKTKMIPVITANSVVEK